MRQRREYSLCATFCREQMQHTYSESLDYSTIMSAWASNDGGSAIVGTSSRFMRRLRHEIPSSRHSDGVQSEVID